MPILIGRRYIFEFIARVVGARSNLDSLAQILRRPPYVAMNGKLQDVCVGDVA